MHEPNKFNKEKETILKKREILKLKKIQWLKNLIESFKTDLTRPKNQWSRREDIWNYPEKRKEEWGRVKKHTRPKEHKREEKGRREREKDRKYT